MAALGKADILNCCLFRASLWRDRCTCMTRKGCLTSLPWCLLHLFSYLSTTGITSSCCVSHSQPLLLRISFFLLLLSRKDLNSSLRPAKAIPLHARHGVKSWQCPGIRKLTSLLLRSQYKPRYLRNFGVHDIPSALLTRVT